MFEISSIKGMIFDCYQTLVDIDTDEGSFYTYDALSKWLRYHGVVIEADALKDSYHNKIMDVMEKSPNDHPEVKVEDIFADICIENHVWDIHAKELGIEAAKLFRSSSLRKISVFPESLAILEKYRDIPKCIVSNGQRVFSEKELRYLGLYEHFDFILFSSDVGYKKPSTMMFEMALDRFGLDASAVISIGDTPENDIIPPQSLGMQAMHIHDAWESLV